MNRHRHCKERLRLCAVVNLKLLKMKNTSSKLKKPMAQNRLLSSRSFWKGKVLVAKDKCVMHLIGEPALTIGKEYHLKELTSVELAIVDDPGHLHWFDLRKTDESYFRKYFRIRSKSKKNGR